LIECLWDIFGGTINEQGYKVLDPHIGAIYGDSITTDRQVEIYERLAAKGFAATNIVLGVGSFTYQYNTRDTFGFAAKGAWFEANGVAYDIYKDPISDDGTKKSLKGFISVHETEDGDHSVGVQCTLDEEKEGILQVIYQDGKFYNKITLSEIRGKIDKLVEQSHTQLV
jgi:nicotinamide phosphoribosyltransferase